MRLPLALAALVAAVAAVPQFSADPTVPGITEAPTLPTAIPSLNGSLPINGTSTKSHRPHKEPTPTFKLGCDCAKPIVPVDQLTPDEKCQFEFAHSMACYYRAQGGCPSPTLACAGL